MLIHQLSTRKWLFFRALLFAVLLFILYQFMYSPFYYPDHVTYDTPQRAGLGFEAVSFNSADGTRLSGWFIPAVGYNNPREAKGTVIHMHGNAQNMSAHWQFVEWLPSRSYNLFVFDYRGYGQSEGKPEPKGVFEDAVGALNYVRARPDVDPTRLLVFGQSLGGMIAIAAAGASQQGIRAVAAEAPFYSYPAIANDKLPGAGLLMSDTYCANQYVAKLAPIPLLLIHGTDDAVVPYSHSTRLLAEAGEPKRLITIEAGEHNDALTSQYGEKYHNELLDFFTAALKAPH